MGLELEIQVFEPKQRYTNGDTISGLVIVNVLQKTEIDQLLICCQCTSETVIGLSNQNYKSSQQHFKKEQNKPLAGDSYEPGTYRFPFSFVLPASPLLPETYSSGHVALNGARDNKQGMGNVKWEIKASIPRFKIFDINQEASHQFWFIPCLADPIYETNSDHSMPPVPIKLGGRFWKKNKPPHIYLTITLKDSGIHQGSESGIKLSICSDAERVLYLKHLRIHLEATTIFYTKNHVFKDTSTTNILDLTPNLPLSLDPINLGMCMDEENFKLPVLFYGSMQTPLISLGYSLIVETVVGSFNDPKMSKTRQVRLPVIVRSLQSYPPKLIEPPPPLPLKDGLSARKLSLPTSLLSHRTSILGSAFNADISSSPTTASTFSLGNKVTAPSFTTPITVPHDLPLLSRASFTHYSSSPNTSLQRTISSSSLDELWEPEYDDDIAALVFRDTPRMRSVTT